MYFVAISPMLLYCTKHSTQDYEDTNCNLKKKVRFTGQVFEALNSILSYISQLYHLLKLFFKV